MDVRCAQCGVEYEFDDDKVRPAGVTVKCTSCGHIFKVKHDVAPRIETGAGTAATSDSWMVRHDDGTIVRFRELTTLQKWIVEQRVSRRDEISKTGRSWTRLGEIAELSSFFQVVEAANAAKLHGERAPPAPALGPAGPAEPSLLGGSSGPAEGLDPKAPAPAAPAGLAPVPPVASDSGFFAVSDELSGLDELDPVLAWKRRGRWLRIGGAAAAMVLLAGGGVVGFAPQLWNDLVTRVGLDALATQNGVAPAALEPWIAELSEQIDDEDELALANVRDRLEALEAADDPRILALRARHHVAQARSHGAEPADAAASGGEASAHAAELGQAYALAQRARELAPDAALTHLAFAAYHAEKGLEPEMRTDLAAAREQSVGQPDHATIARQIERLERRWEAARADPSRRARSVKSAERPPVEAEAATAPAARPAPRPVTYEEALARAESLREKGRSSSALTQYKRALEQNPQGAAALLGTGWCYIDLGKFSAAAAAFRQVIASDKAAPVAHFGLAEALRYAGDQAGAIRSYQKYLELAPSGSDAVVARNALEALR